MQLGWQPVAVVQYKFTHKQYIKQHNRHKQYTEQKQLSNWEECRKCPVFASYTLEFALQLMKKHRKTPSQGGRRMPVGTVKTEYIEQSIHNNKNT
jgi:hypothetical protein